MPVSLWRMHSEARTPRTPTRVGRRGQMRRSSSRGQLQVSGLVILFATVLVGVFGCGQGNGASPASPSTTAVSQQPLPPLESHIDARVSLAADGTAQVFTSDGRSFSSIAE